MQIWYELQRAGETGLTLEEIVDKVRPRVPAGWAWRRYIRSRRTKLEPNGHSAPTSIPDNPRTRASSIRHVIRVCTRDLVRDHSAIKRPDGRYAIGTRKPRSVFTDEQHDFDGSLTRKQVSIMELLRQCRALRTKVEADRMREHPPSHLPAVSTALYAAIERFLDAHAPAPES